MAKLSILVFVGMTLSAFFAVGIVVGFTSDVFIALGVLAILYLVISSIFLKNKILSFLCVGISLFGVYSQLKGDLNLVENWQLAELYQIDANKLKAQISLGVISAVPWCTFALILLEKRSSKRKK